MPYAKASIRKTIKDISIIRLLFRFNNTPGTNTIEAEMKLVASHGRRTLNISPVAPQPGPNKNSVKLGNMKYKKLKEIHIIVVE